MTPERIARLREFVDDPIPLRPCQPDGILRECLDEIERLQEDRNEWESRCIEACEQLEKQGKVLDCTDQQADHIRRLRYMLEYVHKTQDITCTEEPQDDVCRLLAETEPERGYQPRNPTPLDPMTMKPPTGGSGVVEPRQ